MVMLAQSSGLLGAPGVFSAAPSAVREITGVRRDVAAFLGVAPQGPARQPPKTLGADTDLTLWLATALPRRSVPKVVTSWDEYRYHFGGFEGPGRLPYAVWAFFAGGGKRAHIVRIVHDPRPDADPLDIEVESRAWGTLGTLQVTLGGGTPVTLFARNEGRWGERLRAIWRFDTTPLHIEIPSASDLVVDERAWVPAGTLLRTFHPNDVRRLRYVDSSIREPGPDSPRHQRRLTLDEVLPEAPLRVEIVTGSLEIFDADLAIDRREVIDQLGLRADHPRWIARALINESNLVWPSDTWVAGTVDRTGDLSDAALPSLALFGVNIDGDIEAHMSQGHDRWADIVPNDFWDDRWVPGTDPSVSEQSLDGIQSLAELDDVGLILAPDLYSPEPIADTADVRNQLTLCGPEFDYHVGGIDPPEPDPSPQQLEGLTLIPTVPADLAAIVDAQRNLISWAETKRDATLLLDAPLGLPHRQILTWRANFDSPYVAAYYPWLDASTRDDGRESLIRLNPSSFAAAIIAERELRLGVQFGPAQDVARGAVRVADIVPTFEHDQLHLAGVNVFQPVRAGIRLTGARTLSGRNTLRQLSVARLMAVLRLSLEREMQWAVFEPNNEALWAEVTRIVHSFLTRLYNAGAFAGGSTKEAFFVRCDRTTMTRNDIDNGRLVCLVGVAPAEPIEYIVLEIALAATEAVSVEISG